MYIRRVHACLLASLLAVILLLVLHVAGLVVIQPATVISPAILIMIAALILIKLAVYKATLLKQVRLFVSVRHVTITHAFCSIYMLTKACVCHIHFLA